MALAVCICSLTIYTFYIEDELHLISDYIETLYVICLLMSIINTPLIFVGTFFHFHYKSNLKLFTFINVFFTVMNFLFIGLFLFCRNFDWVLD